MIWRAFTVFAAMVVVDYCWSRYMLANGAKRLWSASAWSAGIIGLGAFATVEYVREPWLVLVAAAGGFAGTWISIYRAR